MHAADAPQNVDLVSIIQMCIAAAALLAIVFHRLRQPALLAYILAGFLVSLVWHPVVEKSVGALEQISHLGLTLLLFIIGLELDLKGIFRLGPRVAAAVFLQAPLAIGFVLAVQYGAAALGFTLPGLATEESGRFYFAVAVALSSTAVVVKLLADGFDLTSESGRLTVLTLIAQDVWAVLALSYVSSSGDGDQGGAGLVRMLGGAALVTVGLLWGARAVLSRVALRLASAPDLLAIMALAWCFVGSSALGAVGLSPEMGALLAGLSLSRLPVAGEILAKMISLRDFFMAIFFVALGMSLPPPTVSVLLSAAALTAIVVVVRLVLYTPALLAAGVGPVVAPAVSINLAQLSEFSLLLVGVGVARGALHTPDAAVIPYALMLSVVVASYAIRYNYELALWTARLMHRSPAAPPPPADGAAAPALHAGESHGGDDADGHGAGAEVVLLGYHLHADALVQRLSSTQPDLLRRILIVDYNLRRHEQLRERGLRVAYGDVSNPETLRHCGIAQARVVVSTVSDSFLRGIDNRRIVETIRTLAPAAFIVATAENAAQIEEITAAGADGVVCPPLDAAPVYAERLEAALMSHARHA